MARKSPYASMNVSQLSQITRERGLKKPAVRTRDAWVKFLEGDDAKREKELSTAKATEVIEDALDGDRDTEDAPKTDIDTLKAKPKSSTKGKS